MNIVQMPLYNTWLIETELFEDERGKFARFFCQEELGRIQKEICVKQVNYSVTNQKGAIRGMHFQYPPKAEVKLVRCLRGTVFDVMVDLRKDSKTFLQWHGVKLSGENMNMLYIPQGVAHGFQTLEENCVMLYLHTEFYSPSHEGGVRFDDPKIAVQWPLEVTEISSRDKKHSLLPDDFSGIDV